MRHKDTSSCRHLEAICMNEEHYEMDPDKQRSLYRKYRVQKYHYLDDGDYTLEVPGECFVLEEHDPHAIAALRAYAESCAAEFGSLATDLALMADRWQS